MSQYSVKVPPGNSVTPSRKSTTVAGHVRVLSHGRIGAGSQVLTARPSEAAEAEQRAACGEADHEGRFTPFYVGRSCPL